MFALGEDVHRQDRHHGRGPYRQRTPVQWRQRRRQAQDARYREQGGRRQQQKLRIDDVPRIDAENPRQRHARQIGEGRHRRVDLDDVAIEMLTIQHAFAHHQQPAHVRVQRNGLPQQDGDEEHQAGREQRHRRQPFPPRHTRSRAEGGD